MKHDDKEYMEYKGVEITVRDSGLLQLINPVDGKLRIFREIETAINYIDRLCR